MGLAERFVGGTGTGLHLARCIEGRKLARVRAKAFQLVPAISKQAPQAREQSVRCSTAKCSIASVRLPTHRFDPTRIRVQGVLATTLYPPAVDESDMQVPHGGLPVAGLELAQRALLTPSEHRQVLYLHLRSLLLN